MTDAEINIACAEKAGWEEIEPHEGRRLWYVPPALGCVCQGDLRSIEMIPKFNSSMDACMFLIEKAEEWGWRFNATNEDYPWHVQFFTIAAGPYSLVESSAPTLSGAICEAFLKIPMSEQPA